MALTFSIVAFTGMAALVAGTVWHLSRAGFPEAGRGPWLTFLDVVRLGWCLPVLVSAWFARRLGANWRWQPVACATCWWAGRLGQTACHDGCFWCPRCSQEV